MLLAHHDGRTRRIHSLSLTLFSIGLLCLSGIGIWAAGTTYYDYENSQLQVRLNELETLNDKFTEQLHALIQREQETRMVVGLPDIHPDIRRVGIGGPAEGVLSFDESNAPITRSVILEEEFNELLREARLSLASLEEIRDQALKTQEYWNHIPTVKPVDGVTTSRFGLRKDPFTGMFRLHKGVDIAARPGTPVRATADGTITRTGVDINYGRFVDIDHHNGLVTRYGHLSTILAKRDDIVKRGNTIGRVGKTGRANGYHLHYEVRRHGNRVDPYLYFWPEQLALN